MSTQFSPTGQEPDGDPIVPTDLAEFDGGGRIRGSGRSLRTLLIGAAGVAVIGGGALGFLWISSTPGADAASAAVPGAISTPSVSTSTSGAGSAFSVSGRDVFAQTVAPSAGGAVATVTTSGATSSAKSSASGTAGGGSTSGGKASTSTSTRTSVSSPGTKTPTASPTSGGGSSSATPTPSRSTAVPWLAGTVTFKEIAKDGTATLVVGADQPVSKSLTSGQFVPSTSTIYAPTGTQTERDMDATEQADCQASIKAAVDTEAANAINRKTTNCTRITDYVYQAVFVPSSQATLAKTNTESFGWVLGAGSLLPDAALGKVTGTVRWIGTRDESYLVQVDRQTPVWVSAGAAIPGTTLTFQGIGLDGIERADVAVFSGGSGQYFTVFGAGENAGIAF